LSAFSLIKLRNFTYFFSDNILVILHFNFITMKRILFLLVTTIFCGCLISYGQSNTVATGGTATGDGGTVTFTVGQAAEKFNSDGNYSIAEGVQQPYEISIVGISSFDNIALQAIVFPNPTRYSVQLTLINYTIPAKGIQVVLFDGNGKKLKTLTIHEMTTDIDMETLPVSTYYLKVYDAKSLLKTFKIVKIR